MSKTERGVALVTGRFLRDWAGDGTGAAARWLPGIRYQPEADGRYPGRDHDADLRCNR